MKVAQASQVPKQVKSIRPQISISNAVATSYRLEAVTGGHDPSFI